MPFALNALAVLAPATLLAADQAETLIQEYRVAHEAQDIAALMDLVHWEDASGRTRKMIEQRLALHLELEIDNIEFRPLTGDENFQKLGFRPNLEPVGWLAMFFKPPKDNSRFFAKSFVIGEKDGLYLITIARPDR